MITSPPVVSRFSPVLRPLAIAAASFAAFASAGRAWADPIEPVNENWYFVRVASPGQQMTFTAGLPFRMFADGADPGGFQWMNGRNVPAEVRFFIDGNMVGVAQQTATDYDYYEIRVPTGLPAGPHTLTVQSLNWGNAVLDGNVAVSITSTPMPSHANTVTLTSDLMLSGSTALDWNDTIVIGNGHRVLAASGWRGDVRIKNSFVTGLGDFMTTGMDVHTAAGSVSIDSSIFEATGAMNIVADGSGSLSITNNEFRSNNLLTFVTADPSVPIMLHLSGSASGTKVFQGNRVGAGMFQFSFMNGWLIGGDDDTTSNVFIGPRAVVNIEGSNGAIIRGNYLHHDYITGWSQGFNIEYSRDSDGGLVEHNVIRDASWPVQTFGGEFRYNLLIKCGHDWFRSLKPGAQIHHNVLAHPNRPDSGFDGAFLLYSNEANIDIYHNTFDGGGDTGKINAPIVSVQNSAMVNSFRDNIVMNFIQTSAWLAGTGTHFATADYNCFWNPLAPSVPRYATGVVAATPGMHDVQADCKLGAGNEIPYAQPEGDIWKGNYKVSQVLAYYRNRFMPQSGSPVIDTASDAGGDMGAIEGSSGTARPDDQFGKFGKTRTDTTPPTVTLTAPADGATLTGMATLTADASDNVGVTLVQFLAGDNILGESTGAPYALTIDSCILGNGSRQLAARAWDADGNSTKSAPVTITAQNPASCVPVVIPPGGNGGTSTGSGGSGGKASGGCSCGAGGSPALPWAFVVLVCAGLALQRRMSRRR